MQDIKTHWSDLESSCSKLVDQMKTAFGGAFSHDEPPSQWTLSGLDRSIEDVSSALSEAQQVMSSMLTTLGRERNTHIPINGLPLDVLVEIFRAVSELDRGKDSESYQHLLNASYTCSAWRRTCLAYPDLWMHVSLTSMPMNICLLFLERSAAWPVSVEHDTRSACWYLDGFCKWKHGVERVRIADIKFAHPIKRPQLFLALPYLKLEGLTVCGIGEHATLHLDACPLPRLHTFNLSETDLLGPPTSLRSLTTLSVAFPTGNVVNMIGLLDIFREAPCLQHVRLDKWHDTSVRHLGRRYHRECIHMNRVQSFGIVAGPTDLRWLLSAIVLPMSAEVVLELPPPTDPTRIVSCLPQDAQHLPRLYHFHSILIEGLGSGMIEDRYTSKNWCIKFMGPGPHTLANAENLSGVTLCLGKAHWKRAIDILKTIIDEPIRRNTDNVRVLHFQKLRYFKFDRRLDLLSTLLNRLPGVQNLYCLACSNSWLRSLQISLRDYHPMNVGPFLLQFFNMSICTSDLVLLYETNKTLAQDSSLELAECKLRADDGRRWLDEMVIVHSLGVHVLLQKNGVARVLEVEPVESD